MGTNRLFGEPGEADVLCLEDAYYLTPEELTKAIANVVNSKDVESAARIGRYYLCYLGDAKLGNLWTYIAAQLGDKCSEYCLFTAGTEEKDVFSAEVLDQSVKKGLPGSICEYVRVNMCRLQGERVEIGEEKLLMKNTAVAEYREYEYKFKTSSGRTNSVFVTCRKPRASKGKVSGFVISSFDTGIRPDGWLSVLTKYGDEADRDGVLLVNVYWYGEDNAADAARIIVRIKEGIQQVSSDAGVRFEDLKKKFILGSAKAEIVKKALQDDAASKTTSPLGS